GGPRYSSQGGPTEPRSWMRKNTSGAKKQSRRAARRRIKYRLGTRNIRRDEKEQDCFCQLSTDCFSKCFSGLTRVACRSRLNSKHTRARQAKMKPKPCLIANRLRARGVNSALCLTPPAHANNPAAFAMRPHLPVWPPPPLAEHSSRWSCPSPHGN